MSKARRRLAGMFGQASPQLWSVLLQMTGSAATLGAAVWITWRHGLEAQGDFGLAKSWFDAAAVVAALGLPQGLLHLLYRLNVSAATVWAILERGLFAGLALAATVGVVLALLGETLAAAILIGLPLGIGQLLARSVLLAERGAVAFGAVTALPSLLVLAAAVSWGATGHTRHFEWPLLAATVAAGVCSCLLASRAARTSEAVPMPPWAWPELWRVSFQSWLQAALGALLAVAVLNTVAALGRGPEEVGAASLGLHAYQVFAVFAGYLAPLVFDRLAREAQPELRRWPAPARAFAAAVLILAVAGLAFSIFANEHAAWLLPLSLMLPAGVAAIAARLAGTVLLARSAYAALSAQAALRLLAVTSVTALAVRALPAAAAVALALLVTELATWWHSAWLARRPTP